MNGAKIITQEDIIYNLRSNYSDLLTEMENFNDVLRLINTYLSDISSSNDKDETLCLAYQSNSYSSVISLLMDKISVLVDEHNDIVEINKVV